MRLPTSLLLALTIGAWASAFVAIKVALPAWGALPLSVARLSVASLALGIAALTRRPMLPARRDWPAFVLMGLLGFAFYSAALNWGEQTVPSGTAAFIIQTAPLWTTLLAVGFLKERVAPRGWAGIMVALCGVALLASGDVHPRGFWAGAGAIFAAALTTSVYTILQKRLLPRYGAWGTTVWAQWLGALWLLPFAPATLGVARHLPLRAWLPVLYLGVVPSALAYFGWGLLLERISVARAVSFLYVLPFATTLLGWALLHETPTVWTLGGGALAISGVALANSGRAKPERAPDAAVTFRHMMIHTLSRRIAFSCGRQLGVPAWDAARNRAVFGKEARPHGHDYTLEAFYSGTPGADGMIVNLADIKPVLAEAVAPLDGAFLRAGIAPFERLQPSLPNLVDFLWLRLPARFGAGTLSRLRLDETTRDRADFTLHGMTQTRTYEFAAAHRLHAPQLSPAENEALYGRCNNAMGHGHNFGLEVTVAGEPDPQTGLLVVTRDLDELVEREIFERFDHRHLNEDCPELRGLVPTTENFARVIFQLLEPHLQSPGARLQRIGLRETQKNFFEVEAAPEVEAAL